MTGLFSGVLRAISKDFREGTASLIESMKELTESMRKIVEGGKEL